MKAPFKKKAINRLHILQGQLRGLENMVKCGKYCPDILTQSAAIQKSLASFNQIMMENHTREHLIHFIKHNREEKAIKELQRLYKLSNPMA